MSTNTNCSILYYPGQDTKFGCLVGHADLEFEGTVYSFGRQLQWEVGFNQRLKKAQNGGLPFERFFIQLTPNQSTHLRKILTSERENYLNKMDEKTRNTVIKIFQKFCGEKKTKILKRTVINPMIPSGWSCMDYVSNVLQKAEILRIPPIIKISPLLSSIYLRTLVFQGNEQITDIDRYGNSRSSFRNCLIVNACRSGEIMALTFPITASAYIISRSSRWVIKLWTRK